MPDLESLLVPARSFVAGSSVAATFVTLVYLGRAFANAGRPSDFPYEAAAFVVPVLYGLSNALNGSVGGDSLLSAALSGCLLGLLLSGLGRFRYGLPIRFFGFTARNSWAVHVVAPGLYTLIFVLIVRNVNRLMGLS